LILYRTGSGKSTIALSLFRFVEPSNGRIFIDGIDINAIGVEDLRSRITIIPQDPILFTGNYKIHLIVLIVKIFVILIIKIQYFTLQEQFVQIWTHSRNMKIMRFYLH
jgi:ABC-type transport system involved in Fe-S cluster assembly fused permease/ATPase subunit